MISYFFDHQEQFSEETLMEYTMSQFLDELSALVASLTVFILIGRNLTRKTSAKNWRGSHPPTT
jgi:hypothetical protein